MPKLELIDTTSKVLKPYLFHGLDFQIGDKEAVDDCPFCGREGKFSVNIVTGKYRCWVPGCPGMNDQGGGNVALFLQRLHEVSMESTSNYESFRLDRGYLEAATMKAWGICRSNTTRDWIMSGYGANGCLAQVYRYIRTDEGMRWIPTPEIGHRLHGVNLYNKSGDEVFLCEGQGDGPALWEVLASTKRVGADLLPTSDARSSLLSEASVLAVPGAGTFNEAWLPLFAGKYVRLMYDNDHPKRFCPSCKKNWNTALNLACPLCGRQDGQDSVGAGLAGMRRVAKILFQANPIPKEVLYLKWGDLGYDGTLDDGADVRDILCKGLA